MKSTLFASIVMASSLLAAQAGEVMSWAPPYGITETKSAISAVPGITKGLTRLGLQFWNPSSDGSTVVFAPTNATTGLVKDTDVEWFVEWGKANKVKILLTVYNNSEKTGTWDWALARKAFKTNRSAFALALSNEVDRYKLDGVDLDLEGTSNLLAADSTDFRLFVNELSALLKAKGKLLTVDTFHSPCYNAPNMSWWAGWKDKVDAIHSMGYEDLYEGSTAKLNKAGTDCNGKDNLFRYSYQKSYAVSKGLPDSIVLMGMPAWVDSWGSGGKGTTVVDHLQEVRDINAGVAIWDLQLETAGWQADTVWKALAEIAGPKDSVITPGVVPQVEDWTIGSQGFQANESWAYAKLRIVSAQGKILVKADLDAKGHLNSNPWEQLPAAPLLFWAEKPNGQTAGMWIQKN
jgi:hypothetical protein